MRVIIRALNNYRISVRLTMISAAYLVVMSVLAYQTVTISNKDIDFGRQEKLGNQYQRPLATLLRQVGLHQMAALKVSDDALAPLEASIDESFQELMAVQAAIGENLDFTPDGLAKRKRSDFSPDKVRQAWMQLKGSINTLTPEQITAQHRTVLDGVRAMFAHSGDTSNLILDPDLDSYYLMDVTLLAIPQSLDRLASIGSDVTTMLSNRPEGMYPED